VGGGPTPGGVRSSARRLDAAAEVKSSQVGSTPHLVQCGRARDEICAAADCRAPGVEARLHRLVSVRFGSGSGRRARLHRLVSVRFGSGSGRRARLHRLVQRGLGAGQGHGVRVDRVRLQSPGGELQAQVKGRTGPGYSRLVEKVRPGSELGRVRARAIEAS